MAFDSHAVLEHGHDHGHGHGHDHGHARKSGPLEERFVKEVRKSIGGRGEGLNESVPCNPDAV